MKAQKISGRWILDAEDLELIDKRTKKYKEQYIEHDCHASPEDGCAGCIKQL